MTRPQANAPAVRITQSDAFSPGYIFIAPYQHPGAGPYIYDKFGNLVWDGFGIVGAANAHDFKVCQYQGSAHLCMAQMNQQLGYAVGQDIIIDSNYKVVATVNTGRAAQPADQHDFQLIDGDSPSAIMTSYRVVPYDLSTFNITNGQGWLLEGMFQEVNVASGEVLFEWYSTNHVDPSMTVIAPNTTDVGGDGLTPHTAFDYFHINAIDKAKDGNYLVSARHTSTLYYVNATDQSIVWQLSFLGQSDFTCSNFNFSFQHDVRIQAQTDTTMNITIFDNAHNCQASTDIQSSGRFITLDFVKMVATETRRTLAPDGGIASCSQGNTQVLANGYVFNGWGDKAVFSEVDASNNIVLAGTFTNTPNSNSTAMSYRAFSFDWQSTPNNTKPAVFSYALNATAPNTIYVSWNGATTVSTWRFRGADQIGDSFDVIGSTGHAGFETTWIAPKFYMWVMVEAVAWDETSLANSSFQGTFVPSAGVAAFCDEFSCAAATGYSGAS
ncbi:hypothetical protein LTR62_001755 [Meristemomyces frigidus]|uniref:Uncharacterized protein n=1 Tax=Meristemomyces frigidus TaxID=1508187 RepID=A0AAN7TGD6_9PEZI|nr:hypothetical protein LTR62_001755 [Meristemomyces frigidus]